MSNDLQLFRMSPEIWKSTNFEDVIMTFTDMREMGLDRSPFPKFAIEAKLKFFKQMIGEDERLSESIMNCSVLVEYEMQTLDDGDEDPINLKLTMINDDGRVLASKIDLVEIFNQKRTSWDRVMGGEGWKRDKEKALHEDLMNIAFDMRLVLIVMLATRNAKRDTIANRDLLAGKSNKRNAYRKDYPITTTIGIGKITESHVGDGEDPRTVRPHLRRGHIRTQRYGPDLAFERKIFIEPVFVNASQGWIAKRTAYNVSGKAWSDSRANVS